jgi:hypothetical protein
VTDAADIREDKSQNQPKNHGHNKTEPTKTKNLSPESRQIELFEFKNDGNLNPSQFKEASEMLKQQNKLFDVKDKNTVVSNVRHEIETGNSRPVHCPQNG